MAAGVLSSLAAAKGRNASSENAHATQSATTHGRSDPNLVPLLSPYKRIQTVLELVITGLTQIRQEGFRRQLAKTCALAWLVGGTHRLRVVERYADTTCRQQPEQRATITSSPLYEPDRIKVRS